MRPNVPGCVPGCGSTSLNPGTTYLDLGTTSLNSGTTYLGVGHVKFASPGLAQLVLSRYETHQINGRWFEVSWREGKGADDVDRGP